MNLTLSRKPVELIVSAEVWDKAYSILMASKAANRRPAKTSRHLFTGLVRCGCSKGMYIRKDPPRYVCSREGG